MHSDSIMQVINKQEGGSFYTDPMLSSEYSFFTSLASDT